MYNKIFAIMAIFETETKKLFHVGQKCSLEDFDGFYIIEEYVKEDWSPANLVSQNKEKVKEHFIMFSQANLNKIIVVRCIEEDLSNVNQWYFLNGAFISKVGTIRIIEERNIYHNAEALKMLVKINKL